MCFLERTMSAEERIRRAEEIYNKRRINKDSKRLFFNKLVGFY